MLIVDAHLDLGFNAAMGRDPTRPAREQIELPFGIASVGLPDLSEGAVGLICATLYARPASKKRPGGYTTAEEAHAQALSQLGWYRRQVADGLMSPVLSPDDLPNAGGRSNVRANVGVSDPPPPLPFVLLMEGADPIRTPADVRFFYDAGVRIVGLAWGATRYSGGTGSPGPITAAGHGLIPELDRFGIIHDCSHLSDEALRDLFDLTGGPVIASHSNCRAIVPGDRHLTDEMIRTIAARGGVLGVNFYDQLLLPPDEYGRRRVTLADVVRHIRHICDLVGDADHVGIGTDMDGGLGRNEIPVEIETSADLPKLADALRQSGFDDNEVERIMGRNWLGFFARHLPGGAAAAGR